jgi:serine/threonine-protein kinase RsbW
MKEHHPDAAPNGGAANGNPASAPSQRPESEQRSTADARRTEPSPDASAASVGSTNGDASAGRMRVNLEFDFPSDVGYIERVVGVVIRQCEEFAFSARQCALNVPVALTEALSNAILRGNGEDRRKHVRLRARVDERELVMEVTDEGKGFDFDSCMADPTSPENLSREDGRGLYLMRRLMDRVERFNDQGNVVRLTLRRG